MKSVYIFVLSFLQQIFLFICTQTRGKKDILKPSKFLIHFQHESEADAQNLPGKQWPTLGRGWGKINPNTHIHVDLG